MAGTAPVSLRWGVEGRGGGWRRRAERRGSEQRGAERRGEGGPGRNSCGPQPEVWARQMEPMEVQGRCLSWAGAARGAAQGTVVQRGSSWAPIPHVCHAGDQWSCSCLRAFVPVQVTERPQGQPPSMPPALSLSSNFWAFHIGCFVRLTSPDSQGHDRHFFRDAGSWGPSMC